MSEIARTEARRSILRRPVLVIGLTTLIAAGGTAGAFAVSNAVSKDDGVVRIDTDRLKPMYEGKVVTQDELDELVQQGRATFAVNSPALACQGVTLYFDNPEQADAYTRENPDVLKGADDQCAAGNDTP